jgi:hypothetical protein
MTEAQAFNQLPANAKWSSSFGNPGNDRFSEYYRTPDGVRYEIGHVYGEWFIRKGADSPQTFPYKPVIQPCWRAT